MIANELGPSPALDRLLEHARRSQPLSERRERALAHRARQGDAQASSELVAGQLRSLIGLARRFHGKGLPLEDLVHEGTVGLLLAARRYDPTRDARFFTYGAFFARRAMVAAIARSAKTVRVPRHHSSRVRAVRRARENLAAEGRATSPEALARALGVSEERARELDAMRNPFEISLDEPVADAAPLTRADVLADVHATSPAHAVEAEEGPRELREAMATLPERDRRIIEARFGLGGKPPRTLRDLGADLSLSKERVRQIEERAKAALRERLARRFAVPCPTGTTPGLGDPPGPLAPAPLA